MMSEVRDAWKPCVLRGPVWSIWLTLMDGGRHCFEQVS
jgi:hypothetical protein